MYEGRKKEKKDGGTGRVLREKIQNPSDQEQQA